MKAFCLPEPLPAGIMAGLVRWIVADGPPAGSMCPGRVKPVLGRGVEPGERIMVAADSTTPLFKPLDGWLKHEHDEDRWSYHAIGLPSRPGSDSARGQVDLHPGCVVGSVVVEEAIRIRNPRAESRGPAIVKMGSDLKLVDLDRKPWVTDLTDQLRWQEWGVGRWAWRITNPVPTTEQCPWCLVAEDHPVIESLDALNGRGTHAEAQGLASVLCPLHEGRGRCEPFGIVSRPGLHYPSLRSVAVES